MKLETIDSFQPQNCISGKVMRLNRIIANLFRKHLKPFGVSNSQVSLLFVLTKKKDLNQKQLSDLTILEKSSLNRNLHRLSEAGLITKAAFPKINITEKGKQLVSKIIPEWTKAMTEAESILENEGQEALNTLMGNVSKNTSK